MDGQERTQHSVCGNDGAESRCLCFRECALAAVEDEEEEDEEEEAKKLNSLLSPKKICSRFPTD
jgi:hypothetical protein